MNANQIEYVLALDEYKSFSEVSRKIFVSQPTISTQISSLEKELNFRIFDRSNKNVSLTPQGKILVDALKNSNLIIEDAISKARLLNDSFNMSLKIGLLQGVDYIPLLDNTIKLLKNDYPNIRINISTYSHEKLNSEFENECIDIVVTLRNEVAGKKTKYLSLYDYEHGIVMSKDYNKNIKSISKYDFSGEQFLVSSPIGAKGFQNYINLLKDIFNIKDENIKYLPDIESLFVNLEAGLGLALLSKNKRIIDNTSLRFIPIRNLPDKFSVVMAWKERNTNSALNFFVDSLSQNLKLNDIN